MSTDTTGTAEVGEGRSSSIDKFTTLGVGAALARFAFAPRVFCVLLMRMTFWGVKLRTGLRLAVPLLLLLLVAVSSARGGAIVSSASASVDVKGVNARSISVMPLPPASGADIRLPR